MANDSAKPNNDKKGPATDKTEQAAKDYWRSGEGERDKAREESKGKGWQFYF